MHSIFYPTVEFQHQAIKSKLTANKHQHQHQHDGEKKDVDSKEVDKLENV